MHYELCNLGKKTTHELTQKLAKIPAGVTRLDLSNNKFYKRTVWEITRIFAGIPRSVTLLDLSDNSLGKHCDTDLELILAAIPSRVKLLDLRGNFFGIKEGRVLAKAIAKIPLTVTGLNLGENFFNNIYFLEQVFLALKPSVTLLSLSRNHLWAPTVNFDGIFESIPVTVTSLDLSDNALGKNGWRRIAHIFSKIPVGVTSLDFSGNELASEGEYKRNKISLAVVCSHISDRLTALNFGHNRLGYLTGVELVQSLKALPVKLTSLDLNNNALDKQTDAALVQIFEAIPAVTSLDLSGNNLNNKSTAVLVEAFKKLSPNILKITLSDTDLAKRSSEDLKVLGASLPHVMKIEFVDFEGNFVIERQLDIERQLEKERLEKDRLEKDLVRFDVHLKIIKDKMSHFNNRKCHRAYRAANTLYKTFSNLKEDYCSTKMEYSLFKTEATKAIDAARIELKKHRGWKEVFINLAAFIAGLGVGFLAFCAYRGSFFKFDTDSILKLRDFQNSINATLPGMGM